MPAITQKFPPADDSTPGDLRRRPAVCRGIVFAIEASALCRSSVCARIDPSLLGRAKGVGPPALAGSRVSRSPLSALGCSVNLCRNASETTGIPSSHRADQQGVLGVHTGATRSDQDGVPGGMRDAGRLLDDGKSQDLPARTPIAAAGTACMGRRGVQDRRSGSGGHPGAARGTHRPR